jgi:hypothetical protein
VIPDSAQPALAADLALVIPQGSIHPTALMAARAPKGEAVRNPTRAGLKFALSFSAYGKRRYATLGSPENGWSETKAQAELANALADVRRGSWRPHVTAAPDPVTDPTFDQFSTAWLASISKQLRPGTVLDYEKPAAGENGKRPVCKLFR